jgi:hypothetical protein
MNTPRVPKGTVADKVNRLMGNYFPRRETISHGVRPFLAMGNHFPGREIIFCRLISCLPSLQTIPHRGLCKGGTVKGCPLFVVAAGDRLPHGSWEMDSHRGKWFATAGNGFPLWGVVSCWFLVLLTIYSRQYIRFPELQALSHSQVRRFRGTSSFNGFQPCLCSAPCGMYHPPSYGCRFRIQRAHF